MLDDFINQNIPSGHDIREHKHPDIRRDIKEDIKRSRKE